MTIQQMREFKPIIGDDDPYYSFVYSQVPDGYRFDDLEFPERAPLTATLKERLIAYCNRYYRHHEIVGITFQDFFDNLQLALDTNIDNFEKFLAVYDDDISKPILGRDIIRESEITDDGEMSQDRANTGTVGTSQNTTTKMYELPIDNQLTQETSRDVSDGTQTRTDNLSESIEGTNSNTRIERHTEHWSDVGVTDNWDKLNGFLNNNPTLEMEFSRYFEDCFTIIEGLKWRMFNRINSRKQRTSKSITISLTKSTKL